MTRRARPPSPLPSLVKIAALLSAGVATQAASAAESAADAAVEAEGGRPSIIVHCETNGTELRNASLTIDGVPTANDGKPIPIDPGVHVLVVEHDGARSEQRIVVREGQRDQVISFELRSPGREQLGGVPPRVERGGCCGGTGATMAARDVRGASAFMVLAAVLAARRKKKERDD